MDDQDRDKSPPEIPADSSPIAGVYTHGDAKLAASYGADAPCRLLTLESIDRRTAAYRETAQLIAEIQSDLGGAENISAAEKQMIQHASVLGAIASDMEVKYLKGRAIDLVVLCRVLNAQRRAFDAIGYRRRQRDVTPETLEGFLSKIEKS